MINGSNNRSKMMYNAIDKSWTAFLDRVILWSQVREMIAVYKYVVYPKNIMFLKYSQS